MTEVERYVRDRVAETGEPCLMVPAAGAPSLRARLLSDVFMDGEPGVYALIQDGAEPRNVESWTRSTLGTLTAVREQVPEPPEGVTYRVEEGTNDMVQQVEATALGLSLLQLALNRAGSGLVIECDGGMASG